MFAAIWDHRHPVGGILLVVAALTMLFADFPGDWKYLHMALGPIFGTASAAWGFILCDYARRYLRVGIRVDDDGIKARLYYRSITIRWDEVVSLIKGDCIAPMVFAGMPVALNAGTIYWVYSQDAKLWFSGGLVEGDELSRIIAQRTGLTWEQV